MMKRFANLLAVFILSVNCISAQNLTRWVNPFIGTGAVQSSLSGNNYPGATVPFGMVQLSPDTREAPDWAQASGYAQRPSIPPSRTSSSRIWRCTGMAGIIS